jgi:demethylmenaquinone methyltransferase/2-methoxy-6-polyprenyl-1,4-benzoquinol methylase
MNILKRGLKLKKEREFHQKMEDYNLADPESKKEFNKALFSPVSQVYSKITRILSFGRDKAWKRMVMKGLPQIDAPRILDLACGPGDLCFLEAKKYPMAHITGVDLNPGMLEQAAKNLQLNESLKKQIEFREVDMNQLDFPSGEFDIITGGYALRNSPDLELTIKEIYRLMKIGGTAAFLDFSKSSHKGLQRFQVALLRFWGSLWGAVYHKNPQVYGYIAESLKGFPDNKAFCQLLEDCGFTILRYRSVCSGLLHVTHIRKAN